MGFDCEVRLKYGTVASVQMRASSHNLPMISASCLGIRAKRAANSYFQLRDGSASGIGKNFGFGSGIVYICKKNEQSGIGNLDRVFLGTS